MKQTVKLEVNGDAAEVAVEPRETLLDVLRDHLGLTGAHAGFAQEGEHQPIGWRRAGDGSIQCALLILLADRSRQGPPAAQRRQLHQGALHAQAAADRPCE